MRGSRRVRHHTEPPEVLSLPGWVPPIVELGGVAAGGALGALWGGLAGAVIGGVAGSLPGVGLQWRLGADQERMIDYLRRRVERPSRWELEDQRRRMQALEDTARTLGRRW
jgi:hypothetical protein